ncbi:hypothetical protein WG907_09340 [Sphingobium sp. AN558]|uniref:hypothetical protein n=1 Tax=Sphingobium sp. AN558 TaxID=3133442 RepID=UPI0030C4D5BD
MDPKLMSSKVSRAGRPVVKPAHSKRGPKSIPFAEKPVARFGEWIDPANFHAALNLQLERHDESHYQLYKAIIRAGDTFDRVTLRTWAEGKKAPRSVASLEILARIEQRYDLPSGYFKSKLPHPGRAPTGHALIGVAASEQRRLSWHLPDDFNLRSEAERTEILTWVRTVIISGATEYRRYQAAAAKHRYAIRFPALTGRKSQTGRPVFNPALEEDSDADLVSYASDAPSSLENEMRDLLRFKTATLTDIGFQRSGVWGEETSSQKVEHLGLMFGALAASPRSAIAGYGVRRSDLSFAMLVFPKVWDWYVQWRERRRGFYTHWELDMLRLGMALARVDTGWLRQTPRLADRLCPIEGLISPEDIETARADWAGACEILYVHAAARAKEIDRVSRVHRDPFEPIMPVLEADSPLGEYRKITEEILRLMPDSGRYPRPAAEAVRSFLMIRLGLHSGLRQKNLRQLMVCPRNQIPRSDRQLETLRRGELRWSERAQGWEIVVPSIAFKNSGSSFFGGKPFRLVLPDLGGLYGHIARYIETHRAALLSGASDPGTFFVKTVKATSGSAEYDQNTFYEAWRLITQRYGVFNPYTGRGAIKGLLPHGPHNVRDVLATHILKQTGSYEQASYAIQDTPDMVARHYGRFLPQDKSALAAQILNQVWEAA